MSNSGSSFLRQLSGKDGWKSASKRWGTTGNNNNNIMYNNNGGDGEYWKQHIEGLTTSNQNNSSIMYGSDQNGGGLMLMKKRVMVVVDQSSHSKHAMMWALTHVTNKADSLTLLHIVPHHPSEPSPHSPYLASSLASLCKACKPEVEVEALWIQGPKLATVMSQVKKLDVSVLVLGQKKPSSLFTCLCGRSSTEKFVEECINNVECLTIGVRKQSQDIGGYLISTRWQKDFWLLA